MRRLKRYNFLKAKKIPFLLHFILIGLITFFVSGCERRHSDFEIKYFEPLTNWTSKEEGSKILYLDYSNAITNGFLIPSANQVRGGEFIFHFSIRNISAKAQKFYYKIYYQDESYKFPECKPESNLPDTLAGENFYGSWENVCKTFAATIEIPCDEQFHVVTDSFRIVGNPRDERKYYGPPVQPPIKESEIDQKIATIKNNPKWYESIVAKAKAKNVSSADQLRQDAIYIIRSDNNADTVNNRWERNPRVGKYSFLLIVTTQGNIEEKKVPEYVMNIGEKHGVNFINPYYYFIYGDGSHIKDQQVCISNDTLKVVAKPDLGKGIFISASRMHSDNINTSGFRPDCGNTSALYSKAPFEQYLSIIDTNIKLNNVPVTADVENNEYTLEDYRRNIFPDKSLISAPVKNTECPCKTVLSDSVKHQIVLTTPANPPGKWIKEDVGVLSRNGFVYGKYLIKIKLAKLLNKSHLWDGLTNSMWLIFQEGGANDKWNRRRECAGGYLTGGTSSAIRKKEMNYSEIDFEILKASHYWPNTSYRKETKHIPQETSSDSNNIMVTYTNWDMACRDVKRYVIGADSIPYSGKYYDMHRWDNYYLAITGKDPENDDSLFGRDYYYFEIEWKPTEITWRIGPEKNKMKVIGYMNDSITAIPNNQMVLAITKEFHYSRWWPHLPMLQELIPFPSKDIKAEIYDITIE
jgi:hypothetical protein